MLARLGDEGAGEVEPGQHRRLVRPFLLGALAGADDDHFLERRLLLAAELGAIDVVAPAARRRAEGEPRGRAPSRPRPVRSITSLVSPEVSSLAVSAPPTRS